MANPHAHRGGRLRRCVRCVPDWRRGRCRRARRLHRPRARRHVRLGRLLRHADRRGVLRLSRRPVWAALLLPNQPGDLRPCLDRRRVCAEHLRADRLPLCHGDRHGRRACRSRRHAMRVHPAIPSRALGRAAWHADQYRPARVQRRRVLPHPVFQLARYVRHRRNRCAGDLVRPQANAENRHAGWNPAAGRRRQSVPSRRSRPRSRPAWAARCRRWWSPATCARPTSR